MISKAQSGCCLWSQRAVLQILKRKEEQSPQGISCLAAGHKTLQVLDSCWSYRNDRADMWDHFSETVKGSPSMLGT